MTDRSPLRCTVQARSRGHSPVGTAASAGTYVLVEAPLPWPADVADHPQLAPLAPLLAAHGARLQALVPEAQADPAQRVAAPGGHPPPGGAPPPGDAPPPGGAPPPEGLRVVVHRQVQPGGAIGPYTRRESVAAPGRLLETVTELLAPPQLPDPPALPDLPALPREPAVADVLVCTHGSRDVCCGAEGLAFFRALRTGAPPGVRVWRTSHTGGHRFAPTAVTFPEGRAWGWVDAQLLAGVVTRSVPVSVAARHDRGAAALPDPFTQAADAAVLAAEGWHWLDRLRTVEVTGVDGGLRTVGLSAIGAGGEPAVAYRADVVAKRTVPVPDCGRPLDQARKSRPEVEVVALTRVS